MDDITMIGKIRKRIKATKESITEAMLQEISNLLKPKEQKDEQGNVIDIGQGSTKN